MSLFIPEYDLIKEIYWRKEMSISRVDFDEKDRNIMVVSFEDRSNGRRTLKWKAAVRYLLMVEAQHSRRRNRLHDQLSVGHGVSL